ncbi:MAG: hypothetical protein PVG98_15665 [Chromatiales bacterium]|jgi:hypothetical protein
MPDRLHQLQVAYKPVQDRLLVRVRTAAGTEFRIWLTRRLLRRAWPLLMRALASEPSITTQPTPETREAVLAFEHERALSRIDFSRRYEDVPAELPLGEEPLLASRMDLRAGPKGTHTLLFRSPGDQSVRLKLNRRMLHALCKLIQDAAARTDWNLDLTIVKPSATPDQTEVRVLQ